MRPLNKEERQQTGLWHGKLTLMSLLTGSFGATSPQLLFTFIFHHKPHVNLFEVWRKEKTPHHGTLKQCTALLQTAQQQKQSEEPRWLHTGKSLACFHSACLLSHLNDKTLLEMELETNNLFLILLHKVIQLLQSTRFLEKAKVMSRWCFKDEPSPVEFLLAYATNQFYCLSLTWFLKW